MDNIAYMDLTTPLVSEDPLFVPSLLKLFERERVSPLFITSLVEGVVSESPLQTQIRDASHNLIVMRRNRYFTHSFIAAQIYKSRSLQHQPQAFEVIVSDDDHINPDDLELQLSKFFGGPEGFENLGRSKDPSKSDPVELKKGEELKTRMEKAKERVYEALNHIGEYHDNRNYCYYLERAEMANAVHQFYKLRCRDLNLDIWVQPRPGERPPPDVNPPNKTDLFGWRRSYLGIMNRLEIQEGISIRLHRLDDYDRPMGEPIKIELGSPAPMEARFESDLETSSARPASRQQGGEES
jgi:hypothetical protein